MLFLFSLLFVSNAWEVSIAPTSTEATVTVTIVNTFQTPVTLCSWGSPLEDSASVFKADLFSMTSSTNGEVPTYIGILAKQNPTLRDFVTLQVGQSISTTLNLKNGYSFTTTGAYQVMLDTVVRVFFGELELNNLDAPQFLSQFEYLEMTSSPISLVINSINLPVWPKLSEPLYPGLLGGPNPDSTCTSSEASTIRTAGNNAVDATLQGFRYLPTSCSSSLTVYVEWFGACDANRFSTVKSNLNKTYVGLGGTYPVNCKGSECTANTYAYVYPSWSNHTVFVCGYFWRVPTRNCVLDSQPGTLIHEMSHFNNVAATRDVTYGITNCRNLARNNPAQAVTNADNYCFYTDSCP